MGQRSITLLIDLIVHHQIDAAIVYPEVTGYPPEQIEIIAAIGVRDTLDVADGDSLSLEIQ